MSDEHQTGQEASPRRAPPPKLQGWLFLTYICVGSLFALTGLRQIFINPLDHTLFNWIWFALQILPLVGPLPGLLSLRIRSVFLLCLFSLLYFVHGVLYTIDNALIGGAEIGFSLLLCGVTTYLVRQLRELEAAS